MKRTFIIRKKDGTNVGLNITKAVSIKSPKKMFMLENEVLRLKNAQLKELLKECRLAIFDYPPYDLASDKIRLTNKIDEVLR